MTRSNRVFCLPASQPAVSRLGAAFVLVLLAGATAYRIHVCHWTFSSTFDEPFHIAAGLEWWDEGRYSYELQHPPLARIAAGAGPFFAGLRYGGPIDWSDFVTGERAWQNKGIEILSSHGDYHHNVVLGRIGTSVFLVLAAAAVFLWGRRWFSFGTALAATVIFLSLPPVLGHAALATLDLAAAATLAISLYFWMRWMESPDWKRSLAAGAASASAILAKFSNIPFLAVCIAGILIFSLVRGGLRNGLDSLKRQVPWKARWRLVLVALLACCFTMWASYRFTLTAVSAGVGSHPAIDVKFRSNSLLRKVAYLAVEAPLPLLEVPKGIRAVVDHNRDGHVNSLFGEVRKHGWWYFFFVVVFFKTPLLVMGLYLVGLALLLHGWRSRPMPQILAGLFPVLILLFCTASNINLGIRHVLGIYPFMSLAAGHALISALLNSKQRVLAVLGIFVLAGVIAEPFRAHPHFLPYFNQLAGDEPEKIVVESDLDWGQDLFLLSRRLKELGVRKVAIRYFGTTPLATAGLPEYRPASPTARESGFVAISVRYLYIERAIDGSFAWLSDYEPVERIGKSILLYKIPEN